MSAPVAAYVGIVVSDVATSAQWCEAALRCTPEQRGEGWACLLFSDGTSIELFEGDPTRPGATFPSYAGHDGPAVMPGYSVDEPETAVEGLTVARSLPDWHVIVAPDGLRVVVTHRNIEGMHGLSGFRYSSPAAQELRAFFERLGVSDPVTRGTRTSVVPVVVAESAERLIDPDGNPFDLVTADTLAAPE